jgi:protein-L-isoaspartate(D-aspartate) O-methyltransferase
MKQDYAEQRERMVATQLIARGIHSEAVLQAMRTVPREAFVEPGFEEFAYRDSAMAIGEGQTISQPFIVALMMEAAEVTAGDVVLEIGAGSGYAAAVLSRIAARVSAVERSEVLARRARERLAALGYGNVEIVAGDGSGGWPGGGCFDAILVAAAGPDVPPGLKAQLAPGGRLVMPVGDTGGQTLVKVRRVPNGAFDQEKLADVAFVPLVGAQGWADEEPRP